MDERDSGRNRDIQVFGIDLYPLHRSLDAGNAAADDPRFDAPVQPDQRDRRTPHIPVAWLHHLPGGGKVRPELEASHVSVAVPPGHLLMDDSASCGHPLDVTRPYDAPVLHAVAVLDSASQNVCDGLDASMGMPGEALDVGLRIVRPEVVEKKERIEDTFLAEAEPPSQMDSRALHGGAAGDDPTDFPACLHRTPPSQSPCTPD